MPKRKRPEPEIIEYKQLKTAAGGSGSPGGGGGRGGPPGTGGGGGYYKAGQNLVCIVDHAEPGGYGVRVSQSVLPGFLPTEIRLKPGQEVLAQFVCISNGRILLSSRFGDTKGSALKPKTIDWETQLNNLHKTASDEYSNSWRPQT